MSLHELFCVKATPNRRVSTKPPILYANCTRFAVSSASNISLSCFIRGPSPCPRKHVDPRFQVLGTTCIYLMVPLFSRLTDKCVYMTFRARLLLLQVAPSGDLATHPVAFGLLASSTGVGPPNYTQLHSMLYLSY